MLPKYTMEMDNNERGSHLTRYNRMVLRWIIAGGLFLYSCGPRLEKYDTLAPRGALDTRREEKENTSATFRVDIKLAKQHEILTLFTEWLDSGYLDELKARIQSLAKDNVKNDKELLQALKVQLDELNEKIPAVLWGRDEQIARIFIDTKLLNLLSSHSSTLKKAGKSYDQIAHGYLIACAVDASVAYSLLKYMGLDQIVEIKRANFPGHAAFYLQKGKHIVIFDLALDNVSDIYLFDEIYQKTSEGVYYILKDYLTVIDQGYEQTNEFLSNHPLRKYRSLKVFNDIGFTQAIITNSGNAYEDLYEATGDIQFLEEAVQHYKLAIELNPDDAVAYGKLGSSLDVFYEVTDDTDYLEEARSFNEHAIQLNPIDPIDHYNSGIMYYHFFRKTGNLDYLKKVITFYKRVIQLDPTFSRAFTNLGVAYSDMFKETQNKEYLEQSISLYAQRIRHEPSDSVSHNNLGKAYLDRFGYTQSKDDLEISLSHLETAIQLNPNFSKAHSNLAIVYRRFFRVTGKESYLEKTFSSYKRAIEVNPNNAEAYYNLGDTYYEEGKTPDDKRRSIENFTFAFVKGLDRKYISSLPPGISPEVEGRLVGQANNLAELDLQISL